MMCGRFFLLFMISFLFSCGSNPNVQVNLTGTSAFADTNVRDIVFVITNIPGAGGGLDQDGDGQADGFVYPSGCGAAKPAGCGFAPHAGNVTVGDLPLNFTYKITVQLRDTAGTVIHSGNATFDNIENAQAVAIAVN